MQLPYHPAPGFGDLMPGFFVVPQNPIMPDRTPMVPSVQAATGGQPVARGRMGELLPGKFSVPQNPLLMALAGSGPVTEKSFTGSLAGLGCGGGCGCGSAGTGSCGCSGANFYGMSGLGGPVEDITAWAQKPMFAGVPNWLVFGGAALALYMLMSPGGSEYKEKRAALRSQYRGYRRVAREVA